METTSKTGSKTGNSYSQWQRLTAIAATCGAFCLGACDKKPAEAGPVSPDTGVEAPVVPGGQISTEGGTTDPNSQGSTGEVADIPANDFEAIPEGYKRVTTLQGMSFNVPEEYDAHNNDSGNLYSEPLESLDQDGSSALYYQTYFSEGENLGEVLSNIWSYNGQGQEYSIYTDVSITGANGQPVDSECLLQDWLDGTYAVTCYVTGPNGTHRVKVHQSGTSTFNDVLAAAKALNITVQ